MAAIASPNATTEECYLLQKLTRALGSSHIDYRIREQDFSDQQGNNVATQLGMPIEAIGSLDVVLLVGSDARHEQPIISHRISSPSEDAGLIS